IEVARPSERQNLSEWLGDNISSPVPSGTPEGHFDMLVAGCGTGQEVVDLASVFRDVTIDAFDLSAASLAYAARKISERGLKNVRLEQADILEMASFPRRYDIVVASGVLHHLTDPLEGWRLLAGLTKPGSYMLIALYSEIGRHDVSALSAFGREGGYGTSPEELRRFRADILALPKGDGVRNYALNRDDFYNLSMLRDMVFHVNEHRFTIEKIGKAVTALGLQFCGFLIESELRAAFEKKFGKASALSLDAWSKFEAANPRAFRQMYHFVVSKRPAPH
ncbi:MAG: class I SAM-dependent methyltransferase, partial [Candidatus Binatia bacterium]